MIPSIKVFDWQYDKKLQAYSLMTTITIGEYLKLTAGTEENLEIQRKIVSIKKSKIYERLVQDLMKGCIIPPIVLVVRSNHEVIKEELSKDTPSKEILNDSLSTLTPTDVSILDGLQRTNCLRHAFVELQGDQEKLNAFVNREIRVEFWVDIKFQAILYRMITLNAGQTPMSMKHQLEILNIHILDSIRTARPDIEIYTVRDAGKRTGSKQYQFSMLVEGYNAFINKSPFTDSKNEVIEELNRVNFLESFVNFDKKIAIENFVDVLSAIDEALCNKYNEVRDSNEGTSIRYGYQFFGKDPYFVGFCAALGRANHELSQEEYDERVQKLIDLLEGEDEDPLQLELLNSLVAKIPSSAKVGDVQREMTTEVFEQFFILGRNFNSAWMYAGSKVKSK
jgi:hypothetical protein